jgi:hypothetical protein
MKLKQFLRWHHQGYKCDQIKKTAKIMTVFLGSEPVGIQTPSLLIRSQMLYSVKLQAH